jgi:predicted aspartyl protease
VSNDS